MDNLFDKDSFEKAFNSYLTCASHKAYATIVNRQNDDANRKFQKAKEALNLIIDEINSKKLSPC